MPTVKRSMTVWAVLAAAMVALSTAAHAATPIDLGPGSTPTVSVGPDGTGYVVYNSPSDNSFFFCAIPRGASACAGGAPVHFLPTLGGTFGQIPNPRVFRKSDGTLVVVIGQVAFPGYIEAWTSSTNGVSWTPSPASDGTVIGRPYIADPSGDSILSPDGTAAMIINQEPTTSGVRFQFDPLAGGGSMTDHMFGMLGDNGGTNGSLASASATLTVAAFQHFTAGFTGTGFSTYSGTPGPAMNSGGWSAIQNLDADDDAPHLTQGPSGVGMLEVDSTTHLLYRRFDGASAFGAPVPVSAGGSLSSAATQDAAGRIHAVWAYPSANEVRYNRSLDGGSTWDGTTTLATTPGAAAVSGVAAAPDGLGWVVYSVAEGSPGVQHAFVVPLVYVPASPAAPTPPIPTPTPTPPPAAAPILRHLAVSPRHFRPRTTHHGRHVGRTATVTYADTAVALTTLTILREEAGVRRGSSCVARPHHRRAGEHRCTRHVSVATLHHTDVAGTEHVTLTGRAGGSVLPRATYVLSAIARNAAGTSRAATTTFTITR